MRPDPSKGQDALDCLMLNTWEAPPLELMDELMDIPGGVTPSRVRRSDRVGLLLNNILVLWGAGMIAAFWQPLESMFKEVSRVLLEVGVRSPAMLSHPALAITLSGVLLVALFWPAAHKHPGNR